MISNRPAPYPDNEVQRAQRVKSLCYRDSVADEVLDHIVALATDLFQTPISIISILEENQQWFQAKRGIAASDTARDVSFCAHTILAEGILEVPDTLLDVRFAQNQLVLGEPGIRYYAGAPLVTRDGLALGSLCVIDTAPRPPMSAREAAQLTRLADMVVSRLYELRTSTFIDQATQLPNRVRLEEDIHQQLVHGQENTLVVVDMLTPLFLNDIVKALGYPFSLELVGCMGQRLHRLIGAERALYKIGITRFAFIVGNECGLETLFAGIREVFQHPVHHNDIPVQTQLGMGALRLLGESLQAREWVRLVVSAADHARDCGLDWSLYERCFDTNQQRAFTLLSALSFAVNAPDQLSLVYQPRINLGTGQCSSVEALLRWVHPTLGPVAPDEFVRLAEKTALMRPLSLWVLEATLTQARIWHDQGCRFKVAMNVSPADLESSDFTDKLIAGLQRHGVSPSMLEIEFTESALIKNPTQVRRQLQRMRELDIEVAIDDFGTGYSNWTYLRELPATTVKLDRSLVSNIYTDEKDRRLVSTLIDLAQRLGYRVVAEGIEDGETLALVKQWGCDEAQGFFIARPMLGDQLTAWVDSVEGCHSGMARCESHCG